jgi:hypothetical protein
MSNKYHANCREISLHLLWTDATGILLAMTLVKAVRTCVCPLVAGNYKRDQAALRCATQKRKQATHGVSQPQTTSIPSHRVTQILHFKQFSATTGCGSRHTVQ